MVRSDTPLCAAVRVLHQPALVCDAVGDVRTANAAAHRLLGRAPTGRALDDVLPGARAAPTARTTIRRADRVPRLVETQCSDPDAAGDRLVLAREVEVSSLLAETQRALDVAFENAPTGMALFDPDGCFRRVNAATCELLGRPAEELVGMREQHLTHPDDRPADVAAAWRVLSGEIDRWQVEKRYLRPGGGVVWAIASLTFLRTPEGLPLMWVGQLQDTTRRKALEHGLRRAADEDPLTGLPNRRRILDELGAVLGEAARTEARGALLLLDLDGFKEINDTRGHVAGDEVLRRVGEALRARVGTAELAGRLGGDEFAVIVRVASPADAERRADELRAAVAALPLAHLAGDGLRASVGHACFGGPDEPGCVEELLVVADRRMYAEKFAGRAAGLRGDRRGAAPDGGPLARS